MRVRSAFAVAVVLALAPVGKVPEPARAADNSTVVI